MTKENTKTHFPDAFLLVQGKPWIAEPQRVLIGPEELRQQINALAYQAEKERNEARVWDLYEEWDQIAKSNELNF